MWMWVYFTKKVHELVLSRIIFHYILHFYKSIFYYYLYYNKKKINLKREVLMKYNTTSLPFPCMAVLAWSTEHYEAETLVLMPGGSQTRLKLHSDYYLSLVQSRMRTRQCCLGQRPSHASPVLFPWCWTCNSHHWIATAKGPTHSCTQQWSWF